MSCAANRLKIFMWRDNLFLRSLPVTLVLLASPLIIAAGIGVKQAAVPLVATTAWIVTALMIFMIFYSVIARKGQASPVPA